jgi:hypothetical protein
LHVINLRYLIIGLENYFYILFYFILFKK